MKDQKKGVEEALNEIKKRFVSSEVEFIEKWIKQVYKKGWKDGYNNKSYYDQYPEDIVVKNLEIKGNLIEKIK